MAKTSKMVTNVLSKRDWEKIKALSPAELRPGVVLFAGEEWTYEEVA